MFSSGRSLCCMDQLGTETAFTRWKTDTCDTSKQGNRHVKRLWLARLMGRRPIKVAAVALANKIARMAWAMMVRRERFKEPKLLPAA